MLPAINAVSEQSTSILHRIKNLIRALVTQGRLKHCMLLAITKKKKMTEKLNLTDVVNEFCFSSDERSRIFGRFFQDDLRFKVLNF